MGSFIDSAKIIENTSSDDPNRENPCSFKLRKLLSSDLRVDYSTIYQLDLSNCDIEQLPPGIQRLNLRHLNLSHNKLKEVPSMLYSGLESLTFLDLSYNSLTSFDIEPACCQSIEILILNDNKIANLPQWILIGRSPKLIELIYSNNLVTDLTTEHRLNLKKIEICNSHLLDIDLQFFKRLMSLEYLDIGNTSGHKESENHFKDLDKLFLKPKWNRLEVLRLNYLMVSILPEGIFWISTLTELSLVNCDLSWISQDVKYLTNLKILDISNNNVVSIPNEIGDLEHLQIIKAPKNMISKVPDSFKGNLNLVDLYSNYMDHFPDCLKEVEFIDLELNCVDCCEFDDSYNEKVKRFREEFDLNDRNYGARAISQCRSESTKSSEDLNEDESTPYYNTVVSDDEENWDEEIKQCKPSLPKNPDVSPSDDEWEGKEELCRKSKKNSKEKREYIAEDEEWLFCDVD